MVAWPLLQVSSFTAPPKTGCYFLDDTFDRRPPYNIALLTPPCLVLLISTNATVSSQVASIPFHVFSDCMHQWFRKCLSPAGRRSPSSETISRAIIAIKSHITSHHCYQVTQNNGFKVTYQQVFKQSLQILHQGYLARLYYHIWLKRCHWLSKQFRVFVYIKIC